MHRWRIGVATAVLSAVTVVGGVAPAAGAPVSYAPRPTGVGDGSLPDINDFNLVVGTTGTRAFTWSAGGGVRLLALPSGATASEAHGVNELGEVAGRVEVGGAWKAAWWTSAGAPQLLAAAGHRLELATDINNRGQIVATGSATVRLDGRGASFVVLPDPSGMEGTDFTGTHPEAIDDTGRVLGTYYSGGNGGRSIVWAPDGSVAAEGIGYGGLSALADDGALAGYQQDETDVPHAVVVRGDVPTFPAGFPASEEEFVPGSYGRGLSSGPAGVVAVGEHDTGDGTWLPFAWDGTTLQHLGASSGAATAVAASGNVVGRLDEGGAVVVWKPSVQRLFALSTTVSAGAVTGGTHAWLTEDDPLALRVRSTGGSAPAADWSGTVRGVDDAAPALSVTHVGRSDRSCTQTLQAWNFTTSTWRQLDSRTARSAEATVTTALPTPVRDYVSGSSGAGDVRLRVRCTASARFTHSTDLLALTVG